MGRCRSSLQREESVVGDARVSLLYHCQPPLLCEKSSWRATTGYCALQLHHLYSTLPCLCSETFTKCNSQLFGLQTTSEMEQILGPMYTEKEICWMCSITSSWCVTDLIVRHPFHALACRYLLTSASWRQGTPPSKNRTKLLQTYFVQQVNAEELFNLCTFCWNG